jgi:hypothetical protein
MPTLVKDARRGAAGMSAPGNDRVLVAFDPGISGAAAFHTVDAGHLLTAEDLPVVARQVDAVSLATHDPKLRRATAT